MKSYPLRKEHKTVSGKYKLCGLALLAMLLAPAAYAQESSQNDQHEPFDDRYCQTCHGIDGIGNIGVQAPRLAGMEDWYLKRQLELFRAGLRGTHPQDIEGIAMQPMAAKLSDESIADIVAWVASWNYLPADTTLEGDAERGESLYATCATCHGAQGQGMESTGAPQLAGQNDWYLLTQLRNFKAGFRGNVAADTYGNQMRLMAQSLQDEEAMRDVVAYINTLGR